MRHLVHGLLVVLAIFAVAVHHPSDGERHQTSDPIPALWEQAVHPPLPAGAMAAAANGPPSSNCPLMTALDVNHPYPLTSVENGVSFDIDADGDLEQVAWTVAGSEVAFLAVDRDNDGRITSGRELPGVRNRQNALMTLAATDAAGANRRAVIDSENPLFFRLLLWTDVNHNGLSEAAEIRPANDVVSEIGLSFAKQHRRDRHGNESRYRGYVHVRTAPGPNPATSREADMTRLRPAYEVCLATR
jgi:hypothetical protein